MVCNYPEMTLPGDIHKLLFFQNTRKTVRKLPSKKED